LLPRPYGQSADRNLGAIPRVAGHWPDHLFRV